ncbi:transposase [Nonomuraea sp. NPDC049421]|uniref:RNA-guided endonuclease InsQ/TnpB family protein n=1 Tax=Nonomuraea sp. NPDC049421 TaxID=3155275 RepID=UPI003439DF81
MSVRYGDQSAELKHIRADDAGGQGRWSFSSQQATLRRLDKAFRAFFDRVKAGRTPGFPRFKGRGRFDSVEWPKDGDCSRWYVILSCDDVPTEPLPATGATAGIDMGVASLVTTSDGASGTIDAPGRNVAQKTGLNRSILDAGWGVSLQILAHKAESAGRELIAVNPAHTSRTCARCGHRAKDNRLTQAAFACTACGHAAHADVNAAVNILRAGLALRQASEAA